MTSDEKREAYIKGDYWFEARYLCGRTDLWNVDDWVRYIDAHGGWL